MAAHRLRAPGVDGALLADPPMASAAGVLDANASRLAAWDHDFQGRRAGRLRAMARTQVIERARGFLARAGFDPPPAPEGAGVGRLVVTGHQPELFHPGVWVKNFATAAIAGRAGGLGLNLVVDNDILKSPGIRVPRVSGRSLRSERVEFDEWRGETPYEDLTVADEATFDAFPARVREILPGEIADPLVDAFWPHAQAARGWTDRLGYRFASARHALEESWGVRNLEVPVSALCETEAFLWFVSHLLAHLPRFQKVHNEAVAAYRAVYGIRSRHHPVPDLGRQGDWLEAPFWVWRAGQPRRRSLLARQRADVLELRIGGEDATLLELPLSPDREACCAVDRLLELPSRGVRLRTRALTTTMFARLLLGDLFLHGIGGAKYDELGDEIVRRFFGFEPPTYMTLSMTLWLGLADSPDAPERLAHVERELRDLEWKPERWLGDATAPPVRAALAAKASAVESGPTDPAGKLARFRAIREATGRLQDWVGDVRARLLAERDAVIDDARRDRVARSREFALVLHSQSRLRDALARALPGRAVTS